MGIHLYICHQYKTSSDVFGVNHFFVNVKGATTMDRPYNYALSKKIRLESAT